MKRDVVINSRVLQSQFERWQEACTKTGIKFSEMTAKCALEFGALQDALLYVTTMNDEPIGASALYRDRRRLGMALVSLTIQDKHRNRLLKSLIKSSLPFFRTAAIRDVDAIIPEQKFSWQPFPFSFVLPEWSRAALVDLGFAQVERLYYGVIQGEFEPKESKEIQVFSQNGMLRDLFWKERHTTSIDCSLTWLALDLGERRKGLRGLAINEMVALVLSVDSVNDRLIVRTFVWDESQIDEKMVGDVILQIAKEMNAKSIEFTLLNERQLKVVETICLEMKIQPSLYRVELFRKLL